MTSSSADPSRNRLLIGATVLLVEPLIDAQDPEGSNRYARFMRHLLSAIWAELKSTESAPEVWSGLLTQLESTFDDYVDTSPGGEDFIAMAAGQVGSSLELLASGAADAGRAWSELNSTFDALDEYRYRGQQEPFFAAWLASLRTELEEIAKGGDETRDAIRRRVELAVSEIRPLVESAYRTSADTADWDEEI
jgi:hypothetical protein